MFQDQELRCCDDQSGFSLFVTEQGASESLAAAKELGRALIAAGQRPSLYHAMDIKGERRVLLDAELGIYSGDFLYLPRTIVEPFVLIELGFIINRQEELRLRQQAEQEKIAAALVAGILAYSLKD